MRTAGVSGGGGSRVRAGAGGEEKGSGSGWRPGARRVTCPLCSPTLPTGRTTPAAAAAQRPARAAVTGAEPTGLGRPRRREQEAGSLGPFVCEGRGRGAGRPLATGGSRFAAPTASLGGAARLPTPPLRACPRPHAPCLGFGSYRKGITISSPPTRHLARSPPPPLTSSSSPVGPSASPHSPPQFADFRPPSASPSRRG